MNESQPESAQVPGLRAGTVVRGVEIALLGVGGIFLGLHAIHLKADFPNNSPWKDWAKYTDEGWYGDAAIRLYQRGHWNLPGDFNPAAALPVWPALEAVLFRFTGVSLVAARGLSVGVFALVLVCAYVLLRMWQTPGITVAPRVAPAVAVLLLAVSPFCYAFTRLAILEPMLILLGLVALIVASKAGRAAGLPDDGAKRWGSPVYPVLLGLVLPAMVLTKTTAVFLFAAIAWQLWASTGYRVRLFLRAAAVAGAVAAAGWGAYYGLFVWPKYLADYRYLFAANTYTGVTMTTLVPVIESTVLDGTWIGDLLYPLALLALVGTVAGACLRRLRGNPLPVTLTLWVVGYASFLAYHDNLQPRYYMVLAVPLTLLVAMGFDELLAWAWVARASGAVPLTFAARGAAAAGAVALAAVVASDGRQLVGYTLHPEYTWVDTAERVKETIDSDVASHPGESRLVLSISGSDLSLMTGLPSICDDFGTLPLRDRIAKYRPGWFATWDAVEDDKMDALSPPYRLERVAAFPAFDDPDRNLLILYRIVAAGVARPPA